MAVEFKETTLGNGLTVEDVEKRQNLLEGLDTTFSGIERDNQLLDGLDADTNVVVVSDHGYDFEANHHANAPPGVFLARGPAFEAGRRIEGLDVYDVAPLVLHLLGLPGAEDMPAVAAGAWTHALAQKFRSRHPVRRVPTYGTRSVERDVNGPEGAAAPGDAELFEMLGELGYLDEGATRPR